MGVADSLHVEPSRMYALQFLAQTHPRHFAEGVDLHPALTRSRRFVSRKIYAEVPPRVEYTLTERAQSFIPQAESLIAWAQNNMADIMADRERNCMA